MGGAADLGIECLAGFHLELPRAAGPHATRAAVGARAAACADRDDMHGRHVGRDRERVIAEAADLLYHFLVVLRSRDIALSEVEVALARRTTTSGLDEKASRPRD